MRRTPSLAIALLLSVFGTAWLVPLIHAAPAPPESRPEKPVRVLLIAGGPTREFRFLYHLFAEETEHQRAELSVYLQQPTPSPQALPGVPAERLLEQFPSVWELDVRKVKPEAKYGNLFQYDVILAVDPDWMQLTPEQLALLVNGVETHGKGLIVVGGPLNTLQLARPGRFAETLAPIKDLLPVILQDSRVVVLDRTPDKPMRLTFSNPAAEMTFLNLDGRGKTTPVSGWENFFANGQRGRRALERGFYRCYPVKQIKKDSDLIATFPDPRVRGQEGSGDEGQQPYLVARRAGAGRVVYLGSGETWRLGMFARTSTSVSGPNWLATLPGRNPGRARRRNRARG